MSFWTKLFRPFPWCFNWCLHWLCDWSGIRSLGDSVDVIQVNQRKDQTATTEIKSSLNINHPHQVVAHTRWTAADIPMDSNRQTITMYEQMPPENLMKNRVYLLGIVWFEIPFQTSEFLHYPQPAHDQVHNCTTLHNVRLGWSRIIVILRSHRQLCPVDLQLSARWTFAWQQRLGLKVQASKRVKVPLEVLETILQGDWVVNKRRLLTHCFHWALIRITMVSRG